jgi:hypothetical protein
LKRADQFCGSTIAPLQTELLDLRDPKEDCRHHGRGAENLRNICERL